VSRPPRHLADLELAERRQAVAGLGEREFRADQLSRHYFGRYTDSPEDMTDLPAAVRTALAGELLPRLLTADRELTCDQGATRKTLWRLFDGALIESVLMKYPDRVTMCVSSQAGCGMGCPFCATGQAGLTRNLSTAEIVAQVIAGERALQLTTPTSPPSSYTSPHPASPSTSTPPASSSTSPHPADLTNSLHPADLTNSPHPAGPNSHKRHFSPTRVSNIVFMGMGEPLANYRNVIAAVRRLTDPVPSGLGISQRSVTVSTVGLVPAIQRLAAEKLSVTLAVSLHAPDDAARDELVPVNRRWKVAEVLSAAWDYAAATGRRVSIEYALIRDVNDQPWRADRLGSLLAGHLAHVNLIPLNPTPGSKWTASRPGVQEEFVRRVAAHGVAVTVRDTRGREIDGACGQLAASAIPVRPARSARPASPAAAAGMPDLTSPAAAAGMPDPARPPVDARPRGSRRPSGH
jgi:23S rRNA (adenine2503-C2)-methyltransferase